MNSIAAKFFSFILKNNQNRISQEEARNNMKNDKNILLIDVRSPREYKQAHIPRSKLIPLDKLEREAEKKLSKERTIYVYCHTGMRSKRTVKILQNKGFEKVFNIGGMNTWIYEKEYNSKV
ncbi:MAG: rhodanese-like domain-containing protein [Eubacteriales bacterium]